MADAIARLAVIDAILFGKRLEEAVIVAVFKSCLEDVMVYIDGGVLYPDPRYTHSFKLEAGHSAGRVLHEHAVYLEAYFLTWLHPAVDKME